VHVDQTLILICDRSNPYLQVPAAFGPAGLPPALRASATRAQLALECCVEGALALLHERRGIAPLGDPAERAVNALVKVAADHLRMFASTPLPVSSLTRR
jgi:hypothetical protein